MVIVWDDPRRETNLHARGLDFADARDRFLFEDAVIVPGHPSQYGKPRFVAVGLFDGDLHTVVFQPLGNEAMSFISFRVASNRERRLYDERCRARPDAAS